MLNEINLMIEPSIVKIQHKWTAMSMSQMKAEDRLDEDRNWSPSKTWITFALEDFELWDIVQAPVVIPPTPSPSPLLNADFRKKNIQAKRTICDAVRDRIIPHLTGKDYAYEIWASLCKLYQSPNQNRKMLLHMLGSIQMLDFETVTSYLGRFTQIRDELVAVKEIVDTEFLDRIALNIFSKPLGSFVRGIVAREVMPTWERLWDECYHKVKWLEDRGQTGVTGTYPTQCHLNGEVLSI
jgi:hypothetical protein